MTNYTVFAKSVLAQFTSGMQQEILQKLTFDCRGANPNIIYQLCVLECFFFKLSGQEDAYIPDICHSRTDGVCGEKSVMWRNFKFLNMTDVEKSKIHPYVD